ncbi:hypothetical protein B0H14DRAFT_3534210 [Mycena olivaceomarginata]|nr:hypothetical protein B0H14DRAFT_3534210 [Mycena olivaceomarginata]
MHSHYTNINLASPEEHRALLQRNFSDLEDMFQLHSLSSASAPSVWGPSLTDKLLHNADRLEKVHDWVWEMIQFELEPLAAATLFVQVSWARFQGFEKDALALLIQAQRDAFKANVSVDAAFGEPRLRTYDDDAALVADTFPDLEGLLVQKLSIKVTRSQTWHETFAKELVQDSERMDVVHGWIWYCIAFELEPVAAALLFVKVLCYRFQGCDQEALALLLRVQIETFKAQIGTEIDLKDNSPPEVREGPHVSIPVLEAFEANVVEDAMTRCSRWNIGLKSFFRLDPDSPDRGDVKAAVTIMKEMREVRKARYRLGTFADAVKNSGLAESLRVITDPHTRREVDFPAIQLSDGKYHWRDFLGVILYNWTPEENRIRPPQSPSSPSKKSRISVSAFIQLMCDLRFLASMTSSSEQVFFLSSLENWNFEFERWVAPTIRSMCWCHLPSVDLWDRVQLFRDICSTPVADGWLESCSPNWELVKEILVQAQAERSHLRHVNEQAFRRRKSTYSPKVKEGKPGQSAGIKTKTTALGTSCQRRQAKEHVLSYDDKPGQSAGIKTKTSALGTSSQRRQPKEHVLPYDDIVRVANAPSCPRCDTKPEMERCVRRIPVKRRPQSDLEFWRGSMLTCADSSDVMAGQVKRQVFSPNELQLKEIAPRTKEELGDCRQDIALFQEEGTGHLIGGVQFDAWDRQTLTGLRKNHATAGEYAKAAKRSKKSQLAGKLRPIGSRVPKGGRKGDGYGTYAYHSAQNVQGVRALFAAANDSDTLLETVRSFAPQVVREVRAKTQAAGINRMGRTGMNSFYCWETVESDEYNFAYVEWGIYIRTEANCIWFFNPNHLHGTVLPRQSSLASAVSRGTHTTIRRKDIEKASLFDEVRATYTTRSNFWRA